MHIQVGISLLYLLILFEKYMRVLVASQPNLRCLIQSFILETSDIGTASLSAACGLLGLQPA